MGDDARRDGLKELRAARRESRGLYWTVGVFSFFVNLLMLTGPLYMLNVYDRVLGSRSLETLIALTVLVAFLYAMMGVLDYTRGRIMGRVGARFQSRLDRRVFDAVLRAPAARPVPRGAATGLRDLESVQRLITSPALMAVFDIPWTPLFILGIFVFHPLLGALALAGGAVLVAFALLNQSVSRQPMTEANASTFRSEQLGQQIRNEADMIQSMGMRDAAFARWQIARRASLGATVGAADVTGTFGAATKAFRLFLQSAMLGLGAYLVLRGDLTAGAMIAASILLGRALAPVELAINQWALFQRAREGWSSLADLLSAVPAQPPRTELPRPRAILEAQQLTVIPPGEQQAALRLVSFRAEPGQAIGVIGPSGSGKSTLARALTGLWRPAGGTVRLDGASLDQYSPEALGRHVGYLPQKVQLFEGTIKDNIARLQMQPDDAAVVAAARRAGAHQMIVKLPDGYDTRLEASGGRLSGGQIQRIGLARALFGDPVVLILDEPNSNLDNEGSQALNAAIRACKAEGRCVLIMAHRPAAIRDCDLLLALEGGARRAFGPRDAVLREIVQNHEQIREATAPTGVS